MKDPQRDNLFYYILAVASIGLGFIILYIVDRVA